MAQQKRLSNPFSTGSGGSHFEAHVQASYVVLMLTGGFAPGLPCWPIVEIKLQGKIDGYNTDDLIVTVENVDTKERRKLLGQVKHSIRISKSCGLFGQVIQAAWDDFNNPTVFSKDKDIIALITSPLSYIDEHNIQWILSQARCARDIDEFFRNVQQANFSPSKCDEKLRVIQYHLKAANGGKDITKDELYSFLKNFNLLSYDLGNEFGVVLSLLHSHISQFQYQHPKETWSRVVDLVQTWNQNAGTITRGNLPEDLLISFRPKFVMNIPEEFQTGQGIQITDWSQHPDATLLGLAVLVGAWNEKNNSDLEAITQLLGISYDAWLQKAREVLHHPHSPLSLKNGVWRVVNRVELWKTLGSRILDQNLETFKSIAVTVLKERDPAFELPAMERYSANIYGKVLRYSQSLREGVAEGLAILGSQPDECSYCSRAKVETICKQVIREILTDGDWALWGSLNRILPILAEVNPGEFLDAVEKVMRLSPCPFDELFSQEGKGVFGENYLTGLLWALECLAWDEQLLVRVCVLLGELARHDPGGLWANRPSNSLYTILLPWLPQTQAPFEKQKVAVQTLLAESPEVAWKLIIQFLPNQHQTSFGSYKPKWRKPISEGQKIGVTQQEYWQRVLFYSELAVRTAAADANRLSELVDHFNNLPNPAFSQLIEVLGSKTIFNLNDNQRFILWERLAKFTRIHRRSKNAKWALPNELLIRIENITDKLAPKDPFNLYQYLFTDKDFDLYDENGNWEEQRKRLDTQRELAINEIYQHGGVERVIFFAESVDSPSQVGYALGVIEDKVIEQTFLPAFLDPANKIHNALVSGFIRRRYHSKGLAWCENIDKTGWTSEQIGRFLACLPFTNEVWSIVTQWLPDNQGEYWSRISVNEYLADGDLSIAVDKLIEYGRPYSAINCLYRMHLANQVNIVDQSVRALLAARSSKEQTSQIDEYSIVELIKYLQSEPSVHQRDLLKIEWAYLPIMETHDLEPKLLVSILSNDPEFFCEVIRLVYCSKREDRPSKETNLESRVKATNALRLLHTWKTPPGTQEDKTFSVEIFNEWLQRVITICEESGHIEIAMICIGEVLIHAPADPTGLWIHQAVAKALNDRNSEKMREGFSIGIFNSRGEYLIDPTGKPEKELSEQFRYKAEQVENAGFHRFAVTLRDIAAHYEREVGRIITEHNDQVFD